MLPYFPLANGLLTGKSGAGGAARGQQAGRRGDYITDAEAGHGGGADRLGAEHGVPLLEVAIGGLAAQPGCASVIAGATSPEQVKANAKAVAAR